MSNCKKCGVPVPEGVSDWCQSCIQEIKIQTIQEKMGHPIEQSQGSDNPETVEKAIDSPMPEIPVNDESLVSNDPENESKTAFQIAAEASTIKYKYTDEKDIPKPKNPDEFNFEETFEKKLLATFIKNLEFFNRNNPHVRFDYFSHNHERDIYEIVQEYGKKYGQSISKEDLKNEIQKMFYARQKKDDYIENYEDFVDELFAMDISGEQYTEDQILRFAQRQNTKKTLLDASYKLVNHQDFLSIEVVENGHTKVISLSEKIKRIESLGKENQPLKIRTCHDVDETLSTESDDWVITGLIAKNDINLWYAPPGCGKSHLVWLVGNSTNDGKECLGIETHQTPVTYLDLENTENVRRHFKKLLGDGGMGLITLDDEIEIPNIDSSPEKFEEFITTLPKGVIIIDTFTMITSQTRFAEGKWEVDPMVKVLRRLCAKGYTFVLIFHSLKADPKTIKGPQELIGRAGHIVSIYNVPDVGETDEKEDESEDVDPNKPRTLFVGTGANLKTRHKKYLYWLRADLNEGSDQKGFRRLGSPSDTLLEKIQMELIHYLENKDVTQNTDDYFPNQGEFIDLIVPLLNGKDKDRKARKYIKQGDGKYWTEKVISYNNYRYHPKDL